MIEIAGEKVILTLSTLSNCSQTDSSPIKLPHQPEQHYYFICLLDFCQRVGKHSLHVLSILYLFTKSEIGNVLYFIFFLEMNIEKTIKL